MNQLILPTIAANRVSLRWLEDADVDSLFEIFSDKEAMLYWSSPAMTTRADAENLLSKIREHFRRGDLFQWGVRLNSNDKVIGTCTLSDIDLENRRAEIGYALNRRFWGQGLMKEALGALLEHAFGAMNLHRIEADVDPDNSSSIRLLEKLGFEREGFMRERWIVGGELHDTVFLGLLKKEWNARKAFAR